MFKVSFLAYYFTVLAFIEIRLQAQEFNCTVSINKERVTNQNNPVFDQIKQGIFNLFNTTVWTKEEFKEEEKIKCNITLLFTNGTDANNNNFEAEVQIESYRPVYGTNYQSSTFLFQDMNWRFSYLSGQPLNYSKNFTNDNLVFLVSFYAYLILGYDFDSFSPLGGTSYFQEALTIVNNAQQFFNNDNFGWTSRQARNRYWFAQHLTGGSYEIFRKNCYDYHLQGLDKFESNPNQARTNMITILKTAKELRNITPISITLDTFINTKSQELYSAFSKADLDVKKELVTLIEEVFPSKAPVFRKILKE